jgi:hypothetical protein
MNQPRREYPVPAAQWADLIDELDRWNEAGKVATLWWRDDDAVGPGDRLDRLLSIGGDVPIAIAVIPAVADAQLADWLAHAVRSHQTWRLFVMQHGWRHQNHSLRGKKSEFPSERSGAMAAGDLAAGRRRLAMLFGARALPVLAPPWNRFDCRLLSLLVDCGLRGISQIGPRRAVCPALGVVAANVHVDLVAWAGNRGFVGEDVALRGLIGHLSARRSARVDTVEPTGILTHHLVQDEATGTFLRKLVAVTGAHRAVRWLDATEVFAMDGCSWRP